MYIQYTLFYPETKPTKKEKITASNGIFSSTLHTRKKKEIEMANNLILEISKLLVLAPLKSQYTVSQISQFGVIYKTT